MCVCFLYVFNSVVLVNLLKSNLTRKEGYLGQLSEPIYLKGLVFAKFLILRGTTTAFTFFVLHRQRYVAISWFPLMRVFFSLSICSTASGSLIYKIF